LKGLEGAVAGASAFAAVVQTVDIVPSAWAFLARISLSIYLCAVSFASYISFECDGQFGSVIAVDSMAVLKLALELIAILPSIGPVAVLHVFVVLTLVCIARH
jgi:hypothetical protein